MGEQYALALPIEAPSPAPDPLAPIRALKLAFHVAHTRRRAIEGREHPDKLALIAARESAADAYHEALRALPRELIVAWADEPAVCEGGGCQHMKAAERELGT